MSVAATSPGRNWLASESIIIHKSAKSVFDVAILQLFYEVKRFSFLFSMLKQIFTASKLRNIFLVQLYVLECIFSIWKTWLCVNGWLMSRSAFMIYFIVFMVCENVAILLWLEHVLLKLQQQKNWSMDVSCKHIFHYYHARNLYIPCHWCHIFIWKDVL